jgi:hypothetical protein
VSRVAAPVRFPLLALVLVALLVTGCRADARLTVAVADDGSGTVTIRVVLDAAAAAALGGIADQLAVGDIQSAGWEVRGGPDGGGGGFVIEASKPFENPAALGAVIQELSGADGPFRDFTLARDRARFRDGWEFAGTADVVEPYAGLDEPGFTDVLRGMGVDVEALAGRLGTTVSDSLAVQVRVAIPGNESGNFTRTDQGGAVWDVPPGETLRLTAESTRIDSGQVGRAALAGVLGIAALWLAGRGITRWGRRRAGPDWDDTPLRMGHHGSGDTLPHFGYLRRSRRIR